MASAVVMMVGGAIVNALAFSGSNYLFSRMSQGDIEKERQRHDKAIEELQAAQEAWSKKRTERLDFISEQIQKEHHALQTFSDVDQAMQVYYSVTGKKLDPLPREPVLSDYYTPSESQKDKEILFITVGMLGVGFVAYYLGKTKS